MNRRCTLDALNVLSFSELPIPHPPTGGAVVKVVCAGICHSDVHIRRRMYHPQFTFPRVLGHEISGTIYSMGEGSVQARPDLSVGDNVCVFPWGMCQECNNCAADVQYCPTMHYGRGSAGVYIYGVWRDGGYQQYVVIDLIKFLERVPDNVSMGAAATLMCSGVTSYNAISTLEESIMRAQRVNGEALVALIGSGGLALWAIKILKAIYPTHIKIAAIDVNDDKLEDAKTAGADIVYKWGTTESAQEAVEGLIRTCQGRPDAIIDYIGLASVIERAHLALNIGGTLTLVGISGNSMPEMTLNSIIRRNVIVRGVIVGNQPQCRELLQLAKDGKITPPPMTYVTLDELPGILDKLQNGQQRGRAVIKM